MFDWAVDRAKFGISQIQPDGTLPLELARGQRAFLYHLFAAMPLFMLAETAYKNGEDLFTENDHGLQRFGALDIKGVIYPDVFKQLTGKDQVLTHVPSPSDLGWLEIYAQHYSDPRAPEILEKYRPVNHSRMGGDISLLYARINTKDSGRDDAEDNASPNN
jgi:poly(beta-D-mannuronate) lyase